MSEYKTVEGHPIKVGECYQTRDGRKAFISRVNDWCIRGNVEGQDYMEDWWHHGYRLKDQRPLNQDLMRPWPETSKLEVTDEIITLGLKQFFGNAPEKCPTHRKGMKAALQAVFDHIEHTQDIHSTEYIKDFVEVKKCLCQDPKPGEFIAVNNLQECRCTKCGKEIFIQSSSDNLNQSNSTPLKVIKDFVEVITGRYKKADDDVNNLSSEWLLGREYELRMLMNSKEYQALKALVEDDHIPEARKQVYKLSETWKGWCKEFDGYCQTQAYETKESIKQQFKFPRYNLIAITRADATEFYEGEGLDDLSHNTKKVKDKEKEWKIQPRKSEEDFVCDCGAVVPFGTEHYHHNDGLSLNTIQHPHEKGLETVLDEDGYDLHEFNGVEEIELDDGWIEWNGVENFVPEKLKDTTVVEVKLREYQSILRGPVAVFDWTVCATNFTSYDIVAYRIVKDHIPDTEMVEDKETLSQYVTRRLGNPDNYPVSTILRIADDWIDEL